MKDSRDSTSISEPQESSESAGLKAESFLFESLQQGGCVHEEDAVCYVQEVRAVAAGELGSWGSLFGENSLRLGVDVTERERILGILRRIKY